MLSLDDILKAVPGARILARASEEFPGASIDSRTVKDGELFVPLKGERFDGHDFIGDALSNGAGGTLTARPPSKKPFPAKTVIQVDDTLEALQRTAHFNRLKRPSLPVVGVTGSNGKTTTKELIGLVLGSKFDVLRSAGNLNNHIGLPLNLCALAPGHGAAVLEMGANHPGNIAELCEIARPTHGVLTNIGQSHLEGFGSMDALLETKLELAHAAATVIYNADDPLLAPAMADRRFKDKVLISFAIRQKADVTARDIRLAERGSAFTVEADGETSEARLGVPGVFNVYNALAAVAAGVAFGVALAGIAHALEGFKGVAMRYEMKQVDGALVLNDVYNANPASMREALAELVRLRKKRAVAVLGDMFELGPYAEEAHRGLGALMAGLPVDVLIAVGPMMRHAHEEFVKTGRQSLRCADAVEAAGLLKRILRDGDFVLIKGSRGMRMERVLEEKG